MVGHKRAAVVIRKLQRTTQNLPELILQGAADGIAADTSVLRALRYECLYEGMKTYYTIHGHRTLKAPHPVRSAQLTRVPPS